MRPVDYSAIDRRSFLHWSAGILVSVAAGFSPGCGLRPRLCRQPPPNPFVAGGKPLLVVVEGEDFGAMLRAGIEALGGLDPLTQMGKEAVFRGNFVAAQPYPVTTAPSVIIEVAKELERAGIHKTTLFDSHGSELMAGRSPESIMRRLGVLDKLEENGVQVEARDFSDPDEFIFVQNPAWQIHKPVAVHRLLNEAPIIISLPVVKRHSGGAQFTCALKMHFGSVAMPDRILVHSRERQGKSGLLNQRLVHFADAVKPQLTIVDARAILTRSGPVLGGGAEVVRDVNRIILSGDTVAVDAYCAGLMEQRDQTFTADMVSQQLKNAMSLGLGTADLEAAKVVELRV